jgi:hypothetical protein
MIPGLRPKNRADDPLAWLDDIEDDDEWPEISSWLPEPAARSFARPGRPPGRLETPEVPRVDAYRANLLADSLPLHEPPLYKRDLNGVWRYSWGPRVQRAVDMTPSRLVQARTRKDMVAVPTWAIAGPLEVLTRDVLVMGEWCYLDEMLWEAVRTRPLGVLAAELHPPMMLDMTTLATALMVLPTTLRSMHARGQLPIPQLILGRSPLWSRPVIAHWRAQRRCGS